MATYNYYAAEYDPVDVAHRNPQHLAIYSTRQARDAWIGQSAPTRGVLPGASPLVIQAKNLGATEPNRVYDLAELANPPVFGGVPALTPRGHYLCYAYQYDIGDLLNAQAPTHVAIFSNRAERDYWCQDWRTVTDAYGIDGFSDSVEAARKAPLRLPASRTSPLMIALLTRIELFAKPGGNVYAMEEIFPEDERKAYAMRHVERDNARNESWAQDEYVRLAEIENRRGNYISQSAEPSDSHFWRKNLAGLHRQREAYDNDPPRSAGQVTAHHRTVRHPPL